MDGRNCIFVVSGLQHRCIAICLETATMETATVDTARKPWIWYEECGMVAICVIWQKRLYIGVML